MNEPTAIAVEEKTEIDGGELARKGENRSKGEYPNLHATRGEYDGEDCR